MEICVIPPFTLKASNCSGPNRQAFDYMFLLSWSHTVTPVCIKTFFVSCYGDINHIIGHSKTLLDAYTGVTRSQNSLF